MHAAHCREWRETGAMAQRQFYTTAKAILGFLLMAGIFAVGIWFVFGSLRQLSGEVATINEPNQKLAAWKQLRGQINQAADLIREYALSRNENQLDRFEDLRIELQVGIDSLHQQLSDSTKAFTDSLQVIAEQQLDILTLLASAPKRENKTEVLDEALSTIDSLQSGFVPLKAETTYTYVRKPVKEKIAETDESEMDSSSLSWRERRKKRKENSNSAIADADTSTQLEAIANISYKNNTIRDTAIRNSLDYIRRREQFVEKIRNKGQLELLKNSQQLDRRMADLSDQFELSELRRSAHLIEVATLHTEQRTKRVVEWLAYAGIVLILIFSLLIFRDTFRARRLREETERAKYAAETLAQAKEDFVANVSHEVRTPLNVINGFSTLLLKTDLDQEQQQQAKAINRASSYLVALINDILDYAKISAGRFELEHYTFAIHELFDDVKTAFEAEAQNRGNQLYCDIKADVPSQLTGDPMRLRQILFNLVGNALKFTANGEVHITVDARQENQNRTLLIIVVRDTGIGIAPEKLKTIFEAFGQADSSITRRFGGTGLGLTISRFIVQQMKGSIHVASEPGKGSAFTVQVPLTIPSYTAITPLITPSYEKDFLRNKQLLICDDEELNRLVARQLLEDYGAQVREASNGKEAIQLLHEAPADLVMMDLQMPGQSGLETLLLIRADQTLKHTRVIAVTGNALAEERERCLASGMDGYLVKPYTEEDLIKTLVEVLKKR